MFGLFAVEVAVFISKQANMVMEMQPQILLKFIGQKKDLN